MGSHNNITIKIASPNVDLYNSLKKFLIVELCSAIPWITNVSHNCLKWQKYSGSAIQLSSQSFLVVKYTKPPNTEQYMNEYFFNVSVQCPCHKQIHKFKSEFLNSYTDLFLARALIGDCLTYPGCRQSRLREGPPPRSTSLLCGRAHGWPGHPPLLGPG